MCSELVASFAKRKFSSIATLIFVKDFTSLISSILLQGCSKYSILNSESLLE